MYIIEIKLKKSDEKVKKLMFDNLFPHKICDICNMGCYNLNITSKNSGTFENASLFGQKY
jgi:hypothetical protein